MIVVETKEFAVKRGRDHEEEEIESVESNGGKSEPSKGRPRLEVGVNNDNNMNKDIMIQDKSFNGEESGKGAKEKVRSNGDEYKEKIQNHARFVYIKSGMKDVPMTKANPFRVTEAIRKVVKGDVVKVKPLKSGDLLVETVNKEQVENLCKMKHIG